MNGWGGCGISCDINIVFEKITWHLRVGGLFVLRKIAHMGLGCLLGGGGG